MNVRLIRTMLFPLSLLLLAYQANAYWVNLPAKHILSDYMFELLEDCIGKEKFKEILNEEKGYNMFLSYNLNGELENIGTGKIFNDYQKSYFLEMEWEQIFDYFHNLPPFPISNPIDYDWDKKLNYNLDTKQSINKIAKANGRTFEVNWEYGSDGGILRTKGYPQNEPFYNWYKNSLYKYDFSIRNENPDSLFGKIGWEKLRSIYSYKYNVGKIKPSLPKDITFNELFKQLKYSWVKIPIKNYTVNLQVPIGSKIKIDPDTLSATVNFPDSTYVIIQYTKDLPYTKLWDGEVHPRKRLIDEIEINSRYLLSRGAFVANGNRFIWERIRYRYGVTITIYSKSFYWNLDYSKMVIIPATIVMRPKYKNIYLKD